MNGIKRNARITVEQDVDLVLKIFKLKIHGHAHDEVLLTIDRTYKHCKENEGRIFIKKGPNVQEKLKRTW